MKQILIALLLLSSPPALANAGWLPPQERIEFAQADWRRYDDRDRRRGDERDSRNRRDLRGPERGLGMGEAVDRVQRMTGGRVLAADPVGGGYRVKVLTGKGEVRSFFVDGDSGSISSSR